MASRGQSSKSGTFSTITASTWAQAHHQAQMRHGIAEASVHFLLTSVSLLKAAYLKTESASAEGCALDLQVFFCVRKMLKKCKFLLTRSDHDKLNLPSSFAFHLKLELSLQDNTGPIGCAKKKPSPGKATLSFECQTWKRLCSSLQPLPTKDWRNRSIWLAQVGTESV